MKKLFNLLLVFLLSLSALFFTSCKENEGSDDSDEEVELLFWCNVGLVSQWEQRMAEFTKQTGIKVRVEGIQAGSWGELAQQIATSAYAGLLPDCADLATESMAPLVAADMLYPIDDLIERDRDEIADSLEQMDDKLFNAHRYEGTLYSLPTTWNRTILYFNKNVLRNAGVTEDNSHYPHEGWTIEDFLYCCDEICKNNVSGGANNVYGYKITNQYYLTIEPWLRAYNASILSDDWQTSTIASANAKECFAMLNDMINNSDPKKQYSPKMGGTEEYDLFYSDRLGFMSVTMEYVYYLYSGNFNNSGQDATKIRDGYDVVSFPSVDGTVKTTIGVGACPIFNSSEHKEEAWELCKFISGKKFQEEFLTEVSWAIPSIKSAFDIMSQNDYFPEHGSIFYDALDYATNVPAPYSYNAIELEVRKWFGGYVGNTKGFTLDGTGKNSLDTLSATIGGYLGD